MPETHRSTAWKCTCGTEMARLSILFCTKGKGKSLFKKKAGWTCKKYNCYNFANRVSCYRCKEKNKLVCQRFHQTYK